MAQHAQACRERVSTCGRGRPQISRIRGLGEGEAAPVERRNDFGMRGYRGPCPPPGHGRHRYFFRLYACDSDPDLRPGAG